MCYLAFQISRTPCEVLRVVFLCANRAAYLHLLDVGYLVNLWPYLLQAWVGCFRVKKAIGSDLNIMQLVTQRIVGSMGITN